MSRSEVAADRRRRRGVGRTLETIARAVTEWSGSSWAFGSAATVILLWAVSGPIFGFSDTWQLVINTATTIVTFLMVFLIQRAQNKDTIAIHLKLSEIVAALEGASNRLINVEDLTEEEVLTLRRHYRRLVEIARHEGSLTRSHSIEEAELRHRTKSLRRRLMKESALAGEAAPTLPEANTRRGSAP